MEKFVKNRWDNDKLIELTKDANIENDLKDDLIKNINIKDENILIPEIEITKIRTYPEEESLYKGVSLDLTKKKTLLLVAGKSSTGKTLTFDKISHLFLSHSSVKSKVKKESSRIDYFFTNKTTKKKYLLKYDSKKRIQDNKLSLSILDDSDLKKSFIKDPEKYLKKNRIINNVFNHFYFLPEIKQESFLKKHLDNLQDFYQILRPNNVNNIFELVDDRINALSKYEKNIRNEKKGIEDEITKINLRKQLKEAKINRRTFLVKNEEKLNQARLLYDLKFQELLKKNKEFKKIFNSIIKKIKSVNIEINSLEDFKLKNVKKKIDVFIQDGYFECHNCGKYVSNEKILERYKDKLCYMCGINIYPLEN